MLKWLQNCQVHEGIFYLPKELQGSLEFYAFGKVYVSKTLGWQSILAETITRDWNGDRKGVFHFFICFRKTCFLIFLGHSNAESSCFGRSNTDFATTLFLSLCSFQALHSMGVKSFEALAEADPRRIEIVTGRKYPFGNHIKESLLSLPPKVELKVEETEPRGQGKLKLAVTLTRLSPTLQSTKRHYADMVMYPVTALHNFFRSLWNNIISLLYNLALIFYLLKIVGSEEDNLILFHEKIRWRQFRSLLLVVGFSQEFKYNTKWFYQLDVSNI